MKDLDFFESLVAITLIVILCAMGAFLFGIILKLFYRGFMLI